MSPIQRLLTDRHARRVWAVIGVLVAVGALSISLVIAPMLDVALVVAVGVVVLWFLAGLALGLTVAYREFRNFMRRHSHDVPHRLDDVLGGLHELNAQMVKRPRWEECLEIGRSLEQAGERIRYALAQVEQLHGDPQFRDDRIRRWEMQAFQAQVHHMVTDMADAERTLRKLVMP